MASQDPQPIVDKRGFKRNVPMELLALGMSRSGTDSLAKALSILGYTPYHGSHTIWNHFDDVLWLEALEGKYENKGKIWRREDFDQILGDCDAATDFPCAAFAVELVSAYPDAKVILNSRPFESWYDSIVRVVLPRQEDRLSIWFLWIDYETELISRMWLRLFKHYFRGDFRRNAAQIYNEHQARVRGAVAATPGRPFLEWTVTDGWGPLCEFLGKPVPDEPFPSGNVAEELDRRVAEAFEPRVARTVRKLKVFGALLVAGMGVGAALLVRRYWR